MEELFFRYPAQSVGVGVLRISMTFELIVLVGLGLTVLTSFHLFWRRLHRERRSLWLGVSFSAFVVSSVALLLVLSLTTVVPVLNLIAVIVSLVLVLAFLLSPLVLLLTFVWSSVRLIASEGLRLTNLLSMGVAVLAVSFTLFWRPLTQALLVPQTFLDYLQLFLFFAMLFTAWLFAVYVLTSMLNRTPIRGKHYDHIVVLGAGLLDGEKVSPLLEGRINKGIDLWRKNPGSVLVMSGGQGSNERLPEGRAMRNWAIGQGVSPESVVAEERSVNTRENLLYSWKLMDERGGAGNVLVVSDNYHVYRALLLAKHMGLTCDGRGSHVKFYFAVNAMVREFVAFLVIWKRRYITVLAVVAALVFASMIFHLLAGA